MFVSFVLTLKEKLWFITPYLESSVSSIRRDHTKLGSQNEVTSPKID